jgi:hypothetical protein
LTSEASAVRNSRTSAEQDVSRIFEESKAHGRDVVLRICEECGAANPAVHVTCLVCGRALAGK